MSTFVIDASVAVKWVVPEPGSEVAGSLAEHDLLAPDLFPAECANALWSKVRRGQLHPEDAVECFDALAEVPMLLVPSGPFIGPALEYGLRIGHSVYDGIYIVLAMVREVPLVTADRRLRRMVRDYEGETPVVLGLSDL